MEKFFKPRSVAVIGATPKPKGGLSILLNLLKGFKGSVYPINPNYKEIQEVTCYPNVKDIPGDVDLAIVFVPARFVPQAIADCGLKGIQRVMIQSAGFAETGVEGKKLQEEVSKAAADAGIRLWGPNCLGMVDLTNKTIFSFTASTIWSVDRIPGTVSLIVQSGMLAGAFLSDAISHGTMGVSKVCSIGNKCDVDECDILEYLISDPDTSTIGMYLESIPNGRRFAGLCKTSSKPIVVLKGGKSKAGAKAAASHTASMAQDGALISGILAQYGVTEAKDFKQMLDLCRAFSYAPDMRGRTKGRVAILTFSGGAGIIAADFLEQHGLELAEISQATREKLEAIYPAWMPVANPIDLWPAVEQHGTRKAYVTALEAVRDDPGVDAVSVSTYYAGTAEDWGTDDTAGSDGANAAEMWGIEEVAPGIREKGKFLFSWIIGLMDPARKAHMHLQSHGVPVYREMGRAVESVGAVFARARTLEQAKNITDFTPPPIDDTCLDLIDRINGVADEHISKKILGLAGVPVVAEKVVTSEADAAETGEQLGWPVVMKGLVPGEVHKTEMGLVRLDIRSKDQAGQIFNALKTGAPEHTRILMQKQVEKDLELILGVMRDPYFGPCVMCGVGGVFAEAIQDVAFSMAPLTLQEAMDMTFRLKSQSLLNGFRGAAPVDREALAKIIVSLGQLANNVPAIQEIDINPIIIKNGMPVAVDATIITN